MCSYEIICMVVGTREINMDTYMHVMYCKGYRMAIISCDNQLVLFEICSSLL